MAIIIFKKNQNTIMARQRHKQTDGLLSTYHSVNAQYRSLCGKKKQVCTSYDSIRERV